MLGKWLALFGQHYQQAIDELSVVAFQIGLSDLDAEELNTACIRALRECEFIPKVADIRNRCRQARDKEIIVAVIASEMYEKTMNWLRLNDANPKANYSELPPIAEYSMKTAGGREAMLSPDEGDREWARKHFVESYGKIYERLKENGVTGREAAREALQMWGQGRPLDWKQIASGETV
jgi:hypothetical protein